MEPLTYQRPDIIQQIRIESGSQAAFRPARRLKRNCVNPEDAHHVFHVCTGNRWMELGDRQPRPKMLFGEFWYQNELCILFADTNVGKSILAVQIANSITRHSRIRPFALQAKSSKVLYIDFELTTAQFCTRYRDEKYSWDFSNRFVRADFDPGFEMPDYNTSYDEFVMAGIEYKIQLTKPVVLIIDNITCLRGGTENSAIALALMKRLKALKDQYKLSILVLAHTPKRRNSYRPLSADDLQGSKLIINFADSAFALGRSNAKAGLLYIKQIKQRSAAKLYGEHNVCLCRIHRRNGFLRFRVLGNSDEKDHLQPPPLPGRQKLSAKVVQLRAKGLTQRQIKERLNISLGLVNKIVNK
jgi:hypothetical protein